MVSDDGVGCGGWMGAGAEFFVFFIDTGKGTVFFISPEKFFFAHL